MALAAHSGQESPGEEKSAFKFAGAEYVFRWAKDHMVEFTPKGQPDLEAWADMVTVNDYPDCKDGEALAKTANAVLDTYKEHGGTVVRTDSVPRTSTRAAEHLIVVLFPRPRFYEAAFARFLIVKGRACSVVYSHRTYGEKAKETMAEWLGGHGEDVEKELMAMKTVPSAP